MSRKRNAKKESEESVEKRSRTDETDVIEKILELEKNLGKELEAVSWPSRVAYVYNPLDYAFDLHAAYVRCALAGTAKKKLLFLGMNPGPWGMAQNGVPFGEVDMVKQWFKLTGNVGKPPREHPDRKITGLACTKSEVSGKRLWGLFRDLCGKPDNFFRHAYLHNYCPIALMDSKACNITPADIKSSERNTLNQLCDDVLVEILKILEVEILVGIGRYAEQRGESVVKSSGLKVKVLGIPHPSPRAVNNTNWNEKAEKKLKELDLLQYFTKDKA